LRQAARSASFSSLRRDTSIIAAKVSAGAWLGAHRENAYICQVRGGKLILLAGVLLNVLQGQIDPKLTPVPFTLSDRERLIAMQEQLNYIEKRMNDLEKRMELQDKRAESLERRIDRLEAEIADLRREIRSHFWTTVSLLIGVLGAIVALIAYLLYERNKLLIPLLRTQYEHDKRLARIESLILPSQPPTS
jgi:tetrahydromethanopterin S-methyltransferase subunit G